MDAGREERISSLVTAVQRGLDAHADPDYVAGTVAARHPGKPVLGVRIPLLRGAVEAALKADRVTGADRDVVLWAADALWHGRTHEEELAAAKMVRSTRLTLPAGMILRWAPLLDNWLSVDELGAVVGIGMAVDPGMLDELVVLAVSESPWQRRLYVVSLITPVKEGMSPADIPGLAPLLAESLPPVRKAAVWLIKEALKARGSEAAREFRTAVPGAEPKPLVRLLDAALT
ncbi:MULTISPECIES: DNA alkylation repair protein [Nocardia]|uniref:DNA alkylation repair enzyme n=1 Tax=Nocardia africana TaxID=134964 RepID=A0A378X6P6_9NOCA|nr:DNA alkylation repair protein [Nocardia africana]MCC3317893.1 DNA alkylation repair protein [Nocardia africana]SUA48667.1 DNA alkylation repair enzyme [Nocardia africana]